MTRAESRPTRLETDPQMRGFFQLLQARLLEEPTGNFGQAYHTILQRNRTLLYDYDQGIEPEILDYSKSKIIRANPHTIEHAYIPAAHSLLQDFFVIAAFYATYNRLQQEGISGSQLFQQDMSDFSPAVYNHLMQIEFPRDGNLLGNTEYAIEPEMVQLTQEHIDNMLSTAVTSSRRFPFHLGKTVPEDIQQYCRFLASGVLIALTDNNGGLGHRIMVPAPK